MSALSKQQIPLSPSSEGCVVVMPTFNKILCPTDFSVASYEGVYKAVEMALNGVTEICVVYVEVPAVTQGDLAGSLSRSSIEASRIAEAVKNLCAVLQDHIPPQVRAHPLFKQGDPAEQILIAAEEFGADVIILTTQGAGTKKGTLGSVASEILRRANRPVLTVSPVACIEHPSPCTRQEGERLCSHESSPRTLLAASNGTNLISGYR
jgi:nucleotide-binding universal stress UspA family protein